MSRVIVLDTGVLGLVTNPKLSNEGVACTQWLQSHVTLGSRIIIPEIADYEVRRELLRANKTKGIARLDNLAKFLEYLPLTTTAMRQAAEFWAQARQQGQPTAGDKTIDGDMILVAQAIVLGIPDIVIATTNVGHLSRFVVAELWQNITCS
ncbi:nuclease [Nostoc sp. FACHB-87]|uniref:PIN domain-containing protein n=1 Tax=Nostocales TaxID=1161 RepID=UPI0016871B75|nr:MULTISPECIES: PIN domain-containing protein [Nostocales]MBD2298234.1 nuclease [Nostoc sp. FACHB-190]MBD2454198.1 nuclease [Nostoc sp. FACHB-87]MBD2474212.1 nuclease [Anabaena sp. FACHB-83]MBD2488812.1 nuclease [Aulosira sp. FACHB-615]